MTDFDLYATAALIVAVAGAFWWAGRAELREEREDERRGWPFPPTED